MTLLSKICFFICHLSITFLSFPLIKRFSVLVERRSFPKLRTRWIIRRYVRSSPVLSRHLQNRFSHQDLLWKPRGEGVRWEGPVNAPLVHLLVTHRGRGLGRLSGTVRHIRILWASAAPGHLESLHPNERNASRQSRR